MAPWLELPYEINDVTNEEEKLIRKCLFGYTKPFVKCGKAGYVMPGSFRKHAEAIYNMTVRPDDVWVVTFPRSGTTWTQELVWLLENNLDYNTAKSTPLYERFPMVELTSQVPDIGFDLIKANFMNLGKFQGLHHAVRTPSWKSIEDAPSPRFIKTHLPFSLLPPNLLNTAKVVYVARDPRDVAVSYYYLHRMVIKHIMRTTFKTFWGTFKKDLLPWMPVVQHTHEAWLQRHNSNLYLVFYENMILDLPQEIRNISKFLGRNISEGQIKQLSDYLSFDSLRKNRNVNNSDEKEKVQFIRKGEAGGWTTHFTEKMALEAEEYLEERLQGLTLRYPAIPVENEWSHL